MVIAEYGKECSHVYSSYWREFLIRHYLGKDAGPNAYFICECELTIEKIEIGQNIASEEVERCLQL